MKYKIFKITLAYLLLYNVCHAQWKAKGPFGGQITCFAIKQNTVFAGTTNGIYQSNDNGINWMPINNGLPNIYVNSLFAIGDKLFAGISEGLFLYTGNRWIKNQSIPTSSVKSFTKLGNSLFAATNTKGVFISGDNGDTWVAINKGINSGPLPSPCFVLSANNDNLFLSTQDGMCLFNFKDSSWKWIKNGLPTQFVFNIYYQLPIFGLASIGNNVFATNNHGVFLYNKTDSLWTKKTNGLWDTSVRCIAVTGNYIYVGTDSGNVFVSADNAETWVKTKNSGLVKDDIFAIAFKDNMIFAGCRSKGSGVYVSNNNASTWEKANTGLSILKASALLFSDTSIFAAGGRVYKTAKIDDTWQETSNGLGYTYNTSILRLDTILFVGNQTGGVYRSFDYGKKWSTVNSGLKNKNILCLGANNSKLYAGTKGGGVFELNGSNWLSILKDLPNKNVNALLISDTNIIVSTDSGVCFYEKNGTNWVLKNLRLQGRKINFVIADSIHLITATDSGIFVSNNNGSDWLRSNTGLTNLNTHTLLTCDNKIFVGTENGVFMSSDSAKTWTEINGGLPQYITVNTLQLSEKTIYAGTNNGVWNLPISDLKGSVEKTSKQSLKLYPNPVKNYLYFSNDKSKIKRVIIYDYQGKLLIQQNLNEDRINLEQLKPGLHFLTAIDSNENTYTVKFLKD